MVTPPSLRGGTKNQVDDILELSINGHNGTIRSICFDPSSDLNLLMAGEADKDIKKQVMTHQKVN